MPGRGRGKNKRGIVILEGRRHKWFIFLPNMTLEISLGAFL